MTTIPSFRSAVVRVTLVLFAVASSLAQTSYADEKALLIDTGLARIDITPPLPIRLTGYGSRSLPAEKAAGKLHARALAIGAGDEAAVLITADVVGIPADLADRVAAALQKEHGIPREQVAVCATHTHSGPCIAGILKYIFNDRDLSDDELAVVEKYTHDLEHKLIAVAQAALDDRKPARLSWGQGKVDFAMNRRVVVDGSWQGFGAVPEAVVDHDLPVLSVADPRGKIRGVLVSYACHCTTIDGTFNEVHGDWAGEAAARYEAAHPKTTMLVAIGCGADANPHPRGSIDNIGENAAKLVAETERILREPMQAIDKSPTCRLQRLALPFHEVPDRAAWEKAAEQGPKRFAARARRMLARLDRGESIDDAMAFTTQAWGFGDRLVMIFLSGEVVADYSLRLKRELGERGVWVNACANGLPGYVASRRMILEGGYEVDVSMTSYDYPSRLALTVENQIIDATIKLVEAVDQPRSAQR
jgi:hypothetical protein